MSAIFPETRATMPSTERKITSSGNLSVSKQSPTAMEPLPKRRGEQDTFYITKPSTKAFSRQTPAVYEKNKYISVDFLIFI